MANPHLSITGVREVGSTDGMRDLSIDVIVLNPSEEVRDELVRLMKASAVIVARDG